MRSTGSRPARTSPSPDAEESHARRLSTRQMVICRLIGGLGNQLFQYAAARRIALKNDWPIKLDVGGFRAYKRRPYALGHFRIVEDFASPEEVERLKRSPWGRMLQRILPAVPRTDVRERHFHFDDRVHDVTSSVYLTGYWQSPRYFSDVAEIIRSEFTLKAPATGQNARALDLIVGTESVAVHVRRGDYVTNPKARRFHGSCTLDYYRRALAEISLRIHKPRFFVFSDDPGWTRAHLVVPDPVVFVEHNGPDRAHEDLRLMRTCRHHIIANSTFSWWGAWLGAHPDQLVIAPDSWFASGNKDTRDLYPSSWVRM